jgi:4-amino-4-deoxychorismate lyase
MLNAGGYIAEGTVCNIFFIRGGTVCTPSVEAGILDGITRDIVISLAGEAGLTVEEGLFSRDDILSATEVFFTNTTAEVMPVSRVDNATYAVGSISRKLRRLYQAEVGRYVSSFRDGQEKVD